MPHLVRVSPRSVSVKLDSCILTTLGAYCKSKGIDCGSSSSAPLPSQRGPSHAGRNVHHPHDHVNVQSNILTTTASPLPTSTSRSVSGSFGRYAVQTAASDADAETYTLEDGLNVTAHAMGLSAEQDGNLLQSFRTVLVDETNRVHNDFLEISAPNSDPSVPPAYFSTWPDVLDSCIARIHWLLVRVG
jgi:hypothetical protein